MKKSCRFIHIFIVALVMLSAVSAVYAQSETIKDGYSVGMDSLPQVFTGTIHSWQLLLSVWQCLLSIQTSGQQEETQTTRTKPKIVSSS